MEIGKLNRKKKERLEKVEKTEKPKFKYSSFFVTINTNQADFDEDVLFDAFEKFYQNIGNFIVFNEYGHTIDKINLVNSPSSATEVGGKFGRVHLHAQIDIRHFSNIRLNSDMMRTFFRDELALPGVHVDIKINRNVEHLRIEDYVNK